MDASLSLDHIQITGFRNYEEVSLDFIREMNCFVGKNGSGKTNLLDAMHYLSFCKSAFNPIDRNNIRIGASGFVLRGEYILKGKREHLSCSVQKGKKKKFRRNKKEYEKLADHIGFFPLVMASPFDAELILGGSETRRRMMDVTISQYDRDYLTLLIRYNKALMQRNALLKHFARSGSFSLQEIEIWDEHLIASGQVIYEKRLDFLKDFIPVFSGLFEKISRGGDDVSLRYKASLQAGDFRELLQKNIMRDRTLLYTTCGIHKDDLDFCILGHAIKRFGSQGQQKTYLLALKLAQFEFIKSKVGLNPMLLLDDVFDKLDKSRVESLVQLVSNGSFGQVFITDTNEQRLKEILERIRQPYRLFHVKNGTV